MTTKKLITKSTLPSLRQRTIEIEVEGLGTVRLQRPSQKVFVEISRLTATKATELKITGEEPTTIEDRIRHARMLGEVFPAVVAAAMVDEEGKPVFTGPDDDDLSMLKPTEIAAIASEAYDFWGCTGNTLPSVTAAVKN